MVVFTCNHCGESLQKPRVEKHYMIACRTVKSLTCMDCLKDFRGEEYVAHTKCVSETQRYAAKGSVVQEVKKGEVKQENWTSLIKDIIIKNPDVPTQYLTHLEALSSINNVPRTKEKFVKFMQNSGRRCPHKDVLNGLWEFIEKHKGKFMEETNQEESNSSQPENKKRNKKENRKLNKQLKKIDNGDDETGAENQETGAANLSEPNNVIKDVQEKLQKSKSDAADKTADEEGCNKQKENGFNNVLDNAAVGIKKKDKKKKKNVSALESPDTNKVNENANDLKTHNTQNQEITENNKDESNGENVSSIEVKPKKRKSDVSGNKVDTESGKKQKENGFNNELDNAVVGIKKKDKKKKKNVSALDGPDTDKVNEDANNLKGVQDAQNQEITQNNKDESNVSSIGAKPKKRKSDASGNKVDAESGKKQKENGFNNELDNAVVGIKKKDKKKKKKNVSALDGPDTDKVNEDANDLKGVQDAQNQEITQNNKDENNVSSIGAKPKKRKSDASGNKVDAESGKKQKENGFNNELDNAVVGIKKKDKKKKTVTALDSPDTAKVNEYANGLKEAQNQEITENSKDESNGENVSSIGVKPKKRKSDASGNKVDAEIGKKQKVNGFNDETDNPAVEINKNEKKKKKNSSVIENSNSNTKITDEKIPDLNDSQIVNNSSSILENHEIITESGKTAKNKNKKQCRASDFFTGDKEKVSNDESDLVIEDKANKECESVENSFLAESFSLRDKILKVLGSKSSISLSKLQKRVLKAYGKTDSSISEEKLLKKFNRSLKKLSNIEINGDIVKLMAV